MKITPNILAGCGEDVFPRTPPRTRKSNDFTTLIPQMPNPTAFSSIPSAWDND